MNVILLNGETEKLNLKKYIIDKDGYCKSIYQKSIRDELIKKYPKDNIFEEVYIKGERFYLDFFIPSLSLVFEAHGRQHVEHIKYFHKTIVDFNNQKNIDKKKRDWCQINNFKLIEIYDGK